MKLFIKLTVLMAVIFFSITTLANALNAPKPGDRVAITGGTMCRTINTVEERWADCVPAKSGFEGVVERHPDGSHFYEYDGHTRVVLSSGYVAWYTTSELEILGR